MKIIPIVSTKGGTGKTTGAVNLGTAAAEMGLRTLVVDLDPQCSATVSLGLSKQAESTVYDLFSDTPKPAEALVQETDYGVDMIPSSPYLMSAEDWISQTVYGEGKLHRRLTDSPLTSEYDLVIIDTPGFTCRLLISAMVAADAVLISLKPSALSTDVLPPLLRSIEKVGRGRERELPVLATYFNEVREHTRIAQLNVDEAQKLEGAKVVEPHIAQATVIEEAVYVRTPVVALSPESKSAEQYRTLAKAVFNDLLMRKRNEQVA